MNLKQALEILKECAGLGAGHGSEAFEVVKNALNQEEQKHKGMAVMERFIKMYYKNICHDILRTLQNPEYKPTLDMEIQLQTLQEFIKTEKMYQEYCGKVEKNNDR